MTDDFDPIERLRDMSSREREHSHVSSQTYSKLSEIVKALLEVTAEVTGGDSVDTSQIAKLAVEDLTPAELEGIVQDWLEGRGNLGPL